jgi:hypothetical protein
MKSYRLSLKIDGKWQQRCEIAAANHTEAFRTAMTRLEPADYDKPLRLEQVDPPELQEPR